MIAEIALEQGPRTSITDFIPRAFAVLGIQDCVYDPLLDCIQASFTAQKDGTYNGHIRTCCETQ